MCFQPGIVTRVLAIPFFPNLFLLSGRNIYILQKPGICGGGVEFPNPCTACSLPPVQCRGKDYMFCQIFSTTSTALTLHGVIFFKEKDPLLPGCASQLVVDLST